VLPLKDNVPTRRFPIVTVALIATNVFVYFFIEQAGTPIEQDIVRYSFYPCSVSGPCLGVAQLRETGPITGLFTSMFMHAGFLHLAFNMLFLWIFGNNIEDAMGRIRFLVFYLLAGIAATLLQTIITLTQAGPVAASIPNLGASGAISGVVGAYFVILPMANVLVLFLVIIIPIWFRVPAVFFLAGWFLLQAWQGNFQIEHPSQGGGVAVFAHIGGFLFGLFTVKLFQVREPARPVR
jgi:membrane associated rhomboid family serine protease